MTYLLMMWRRFEDLSDVKKVAVGSAAVLFLFSSWLYCLGFVGMAAAGRRAETTTPGPTATIAVVATRATEAPTAASRATQPVGTVVPTARPANGGAVAQPTAVPKAPATAVPKAPAPPPKPQVVPTATRSAAPPPATRTPTAATAPTVAPTATRQGPIWVTPGLPPTVLPTNGVATPAAATATPTRPPVAATPTPTRQVTPISSSPTPTGSH